MSPSPSSDPCDFMSLPQGEDVSAAAWLRLLVPLQARIAEGPWPHRWLVLLPYAQLMAEARRAWAAMSPHGLPPRFETTRTWATALGPWVPGALDLSLDTARDRLVAATLVRRVTPPGLDHALLDDLVSRLLTAARELAPLAAAVPPEARADWARPRLEAFGPGGAALHWEHLVATLALTWVSTSGYATDRLWSVQAEPGREHDRLLVWHGFQHDPLAAALLDRWGERGEALSLVHPDGGATDGPEGAWRRLPCGDAEDESRQAAACVIEHVNAGRTPVALVAQDRLLTRRVGAWLRGAGLRWRDETGWKLSTSRAAARVLAVLRAADPEASTDDVLDALKQTPRWARATDALEAVLRRQGLGRWASACARPSVLAWVPEGVEDWRQALQAPRPLGAWLTALAEALRTAGLWDALAADRAGRDLLAALRLRPGAATELEGLEQAITGASQAARMGRSAWVSWVREVLEAASFTPETDPEAPVVVVPMAQLLGRRFGAVVMPGADELRLPVSPEPPGHWTPAQRLALGLPSREVLAAQAQAVWAHMLRQPVGDLLWRTEDQGEVRLPSPWVQAMMAATQAQAPERAGRLRRLPAQPVLPAQPTAPDLLPRRWSASAYQDLRQCPYRFFAQTMLGLREREELDDEPDRRDLGNWLHATLRAFHEARRDPTPPGTDDDRRLIDRLAAAEAVRMGLAQAPQDGAADAPEALRSAGFLPYLLVWPGLRDGYLAWLATDESAGHARFDRAEVACEVALGPLTLVGRLDRLDRFDTPEGPGRRVLDYKTEARSTTLARVREPLEDTQLAFYAALLPDDGAPLEAGYLSLCERDQKSAGAATRLVPQPEIGLAREALRQGLLQDAARLAQGHGLAPLGEGVVCTHCDVRGLCRKDFWAQGPAPALVPSFESPVSS